MNEYVKSTEKLPEQFEPLWVRINGARPRKMFFFGGIFIYYDPRLSHNYAGIGDGVIWRYCYK